MIRGYLKTDHMLNAEQAEKIRRWFIDGITSGDPSKIPILGHGVDFVQLNNSPLDPVIIRCGHCGQWGAVQTECKHCGAAIF